jgi:hypothetical protein
MKWEDLNAFVTEDKLTKERAEQKKNKIFWLVAIVSHGLIIYVWMFHFDLIIDLFRDKDKHSIERVEQHVKTLPQPTPQNEHGNIRVQSPPRQTPHQDVYRNQYGEPFPGTMLIVVKGNQGACSLTFDARDIQLNSAITLTKHTTGERSAWGYLENGLTVTIRLAPGEYDLVTVSGNEWRGRDEMFGEQGITRTMRPLLLSSSHEVCPERVIRMRELISSEKL